MHFPTNKMIYKKKKKFAQNEASKYELVLGQMLLSGGCV